MATSILPTKLFTPQTPVKAVTRQRLYDQLDVGLDGVLTLVSAPAGYGKSTLLAEWTNQTKISVAWISLDTNDQDPVRFWSHFIAALEVIPFVKGFKIVDFLTAEPSNIALQINECLDALIKEIVLIPEKFVLILDDFHVIYNNEIQDGVYYLLENLSLGSSNFHLIISSRSDPPWPLARLRVKNQINELRAIDLRFTTKETAQLFNNLIVVDLTPNEIYALEKRTEGWAAGLQMAAISLKGRDDIQEFIQSFSGSHRFVMDYLLEEVLNKQTDVVQNFLLKTSILELLNSDVCEFILEEHELDDPSNNVEDAQSILETLEQNNLFLIALDDHRHWFRYHHLFSDLLENRLMNRYAEIVPELHWRASKWFSQEGHIELAIEHALKTNDMHFAAQQIETHVLTLIQRGNVSLTRQWIRSLPDEIIHPRPVLCFAQAWSYAKYATIELAEELLEQVEIALSTGSSRQGVMDQEVSHILSSQISILKVVISRVRGDSPQQQQRLALDALDQLDPSENIAAQATLYYRLGLCYLDLWKHEQADQIFVKAVKLGKSSGNFYAVHAASYVRMVIAKLKGRLHEIATISQSNLNTASRYAKQQNLTGIDSIMLGRVHYEWNHLKQAETNLSVGLNLVEQVGIAELMIKGQFTLACSKIALGEQIEFPDFVSIAERNHPKLLGYAAALQARIALLLASTTTDSYYADYCYRWAQTQQLSLRDQFTYDWDIQEKFVYARVLCHQFQSQASVEIKEKLEAFLDFYATHRQKLEDFRWNGIIIEGDIVTAIVHQALGENQVALKTLEHALNLAESQNFMRIFIDEGEPMRALLQKTSEVDICKQYTQELLFAYDHLSPLSQPVIILDSTNLVESLSEREIEVLRYLKTRLNVPEIAAEIHLSPATVRSHIQNIYRKLDTHTRMETILRAEKIGLI